MNLEYIHTAVGVLGIIENYNGEVLLALSKDRGWEPPGGFIEPNESPIPALHREVIEETGYSIEITKLTGIYKCVREFPIISLCFYCRPIKHLSADISESLDLQWINRLNLSSVISYKPHVLRVFDALNNQENYILFREYRLDPFRVSATWKL